MSSGSIVEQQKQQNWLKLNYMITSLVKWHLCNFLLFFSNFFRLTKTTIIGQTWPQIVWVWYEGWQRSSFLLNGRIFSKVNCTSSCWLERCICSASCVLWSVKFDDTHCKSMNWDSPDLNWSGDARLANSSTDILLPSQPRCDRLRVKVRGGPWGKSTHLHQLISTSINWCRHFFS